jgi:hypothetical protein
MERKNDLLVNMFLGTRAGTPFEAFTPKATAELPVDTQRLYARAGEVGVDDVTVAAGEFGNTEVAEGIAKRPPLVPGGRHGVFVCFADLHPPELALYVDNKVRGQLKKPQDGYDQLPLFAKARFTAMLELSMSLGLKLRNEQVPAAQDVPQYDMALQGTRLVIDLEAS